MSDSQQYDSGLYANHNYEPVSRSTANMTDMNRAHGIVAFITNSAAAPRAQASPKLGNHVLVL